MFWMWDVFFFLKCRASIAKAWLTGCQITTKCNSLEGVQVFLLWRCCVDALKKNASQQAFIDDAEGDWDCSGMPASKAAQTQSRIFWEIHVISELARVGMIFDFSCKTFSFAKVRCHTSFISSPSSENGNELWISICFFTGACPGDVGVRTIAQSLSNSTLRVTKLMLQGPFPLVAHFLVYVSSRVRTSVSVFNWPGFLLERSHFLFNLTNCQKWSGLKIKKQIPETPSPRDPMSSKVYFTGSSGGSRGFCLLAFRWYLQQRCGEPLKR